MSNLAYEGFCPSCHNYWIFCDCVHSFGTIGEDLAKDEGEEGDDDDMEEIDPSDPNSPPLLDNIDDLVNDPQLGSPGPSTPGFTGTPGDPAVLSPTNPDDPVSPVGSAPWGAATPGQHLSKPTYKPNPRDPSIDAILDDVNNAADVIHDVPDLVRPFGKKPRPNTPPPNDTPMNDAPQGDVDTPLGDKPGARLPADMNSDILQQVPPSDFDADPLITPTDLSSMLNTAADNLPRNAKYDIASLNRKYQHYGDPEFVRRGPRPDTLRANGLPIFDGPMFKDYPPGMSNQDKQNPLNMSQEYIDFLNNELRPWIDTLNPDVARVFDTDCYISSPEDRVPERVPTVLGPYTVQLNPGNGTHPNIYNVSGPNGTIEISTKMDISVDFFKKIHPDDLPLLLKGPNTNGRYEFITEYNKGSSPRVVIGQNQQGRYPGVRIMVSGVHKISNGIPTTFYHEGSYDNDNEIVRPINVVSPPPPLYYYRKNTVVNTRRLQGDGTFNNVFRALYENYNAATFTSTSPGVETSTSSYVSSRTTNDNWGDPNFRHEIHCSDSRMSQVYKYIFEMINESNDPLYSSSTYAMFEISMISIGTQQLGRWQVWIDKQDGTKYYPAMYASNEPNLALNTLLRAEGSQTRVNTDFGGNGVQKGLFAVVRCGPNDGFLNTGVSGNAFCCVNIQANTDPNRGLNCVVHQVQQLVKVNTFNKTYQPTGGLFEFSTGELVAPGQIMPTSFISSVGEPMASQEYRNVWTKLLVWRRNNNTPNLVMYLVNDLNQQTVVYPTYNALSGTVSKQFYMLCPYVQLNSGIEQGITSPYCIVNNNSIYPISGGANPDILFRLAMIITFDNFIF